MRKDAPYASGSVAGGIGIMSMDYLGGFHYQGTAPKFFPTAEGYVQATALKVGFAYSYVYNYTDHLGNIRLSYAQDPENPNVLKIIEESHYYPFGLKHANYNSDQLAFREKDPGPGIMLAAAALDPVPEFVYNYKYQGQERQDEMGLNWDSFKWRNYDYAIGRFMSIDPLTEKYTYNSPYAFQENKMGMGRELEGLELLPNDIFHYLLRKGVELKIKLETPRNNLNTAIVNRVNVGISGREKSNTNVAGLNVNKVTDYGTMGQSVKTIAKETNTTTKEIIRDGADGMETGGDIITGVGIVTGQPEIMAIGQGISKTGTIINGVLDVTEGNFDKVGETVIKETVLGEVGKYAKGKANNEVQEYIIDAQIETLDKIYEETDSNKLITPRGS